MKQQENNKLPPPKFENSLIASLAKTLQDRSKACRGDSEDSDDSDSDDDNDTSDDDDWD